MERLLTMDVVPDLISLPKVNIDLAVTYPDASQHVAGDYLLPSQTFDRPQISWMAHTMEIDDNSLYTLVMTDLDCPDLPNHGYRQYVNWIVPNIPISRGIGSLDASITEALPYIPPHPSPETPYHRYTFTLLRQPKSKEPLKPIFPSKREDFDFRHFMIGNNFIPKTSEAPLRDTSAVAGVYFFRQGGTRFGKDKTIEDRAAYKYNQGPEWLKEEAVINKVYTDILGRPKGRIIYEKIPLNKREVAQAMADEKRLKLEKLAHKENAKELRALDRLDHLIEKQLELAMQEENFPAEGAQFEDKQETFEQPQQSSNKPE